MKVDKMSKVPGEERKELYEVESKFQELLSVWYIRKCHQLDGKIHSLGLMKEIVKMGLDAHLSVLSNYIETHFDSMAEHVEKRLKEI